MKKYIFLLLCVAVANAQLINDFSTEWRSTGKTFSFKDARTDSIEKKQKDYQSVLLINNFSYRNSFFDLAGNLKWLADGSIPAAIRQNISTYRVYAMNNPLKLYGFSLGGGFERRIANDNGWIRNSETEIINDNSGNPIDTIYIPEKYETILSPNQNISWGSIGYEMTTEKLLINPQFYYFSRQIKGDLTVNPIETIDSLKNKSVDLEDYEWQAKLTAKWNYSDNLNLQLRGFYSDDLDSIDYFNVYYAETGLGSDLLIDDYKISGYAGAGQLRYHEDDVFYGRTQVSLNYNSNPKFNIKIKNNFDLYQDETYSEKLSLYGAWFFEQAGYDYNQISGSFSFNSKGAYKFIRLGANGRYWSDNWLNEVAFNLKAMEENATFIAAAKSQYYFDKLNSIYLSTEYTNYLKSSFLLDNNDVKITVGLNSGLY